MEGRRWRDTDDTATFLGMPQHMLGKGPQRHRPAPPHQPEIEQSDAAEERCPGEDVKEPNKMMIRLQRKVQRSVIQRDQGRRRDTDGSKDTRVGHSSFSKVAL